MTDQIELTIDNVIEELEKQVERFGEEHVDPNSNTFTCRYTTLISDVEDENDDDKLVPMCIVGQVMHTVGVEIGDLVEWDENGGDVSELYHKTAELKDPSYESPSWASIDASFPDYLSVTEQAADILWAAQRMQDAGWTWGDALRVAKERKEAWITQPDITAFSWHELRHPWARVGTVA